MGGPKNVSSTTKSEPWSEAKPYIKNLYSAAESAFNATNKNMYTGDLWAQPTSTQISANKQLAGNKWGAGAAGINKMAGDLISGKYLDPKTNPWLKGNVEAALGDVTRKYTREVLPNMGDAAIRAGAYGGSRQGIMEGLAAGEYSREANTAAQNIYSANYERERQRQLGAGSLYGQANALEMAQLQCKTAAGAQEQQWNQQQNAENYQRYQMEQAAPWQGIPELQSVLMGGNFQSSSSTGPNPNYMNPMQIASGV